jgi:hypothetical protein
MTPEPDLTPSQQGRLRALLDEATADVHPHDGLDAIQSRTKVSSMSNRPWFLGTAAAVLATAATITAVAMTNGGDAPTTGPQPADTPTAAVESPDPSTGSDEPDGDGEQDPPVAVEGAVPVYYVGDTGQGPRLYREFHPGIGGNPLDQAVADAVGRTPDDPDYRTPWPAGTQVRASFDGAGDDGRIELDLTGVPGDRTAGMSRAEAEMAVQQLVWTAQAATQTTAPVALRLDGGPATTILGVPTAEPLARGAETDTLAQVWIIDPAQGATVQDGFTVSGVGAFFEANVAWELHRGGLDGPVVASNADRPVMAEECCTMAPYEFDVDLPDGAAPGEYTLRVHDEDMSGGEGFAPFEDTKTVTVD